MHLRKILPRYVARVGRFIAGVKRANETTTKTESVNKSPRTAICHRHGNLWQLEQICCSGWVEAAQRTAGCVAPDERVGQLQLSRTTRLDGDGNCGEPH